MTDMTAWYYQYGGEEKFERRCKDHHKDWSVYGFCKEEKEGGMQISLKQALDRAEAMTGVKKRTILDVMSQGDGGKRQPLERVTRVKSYYC